MFRLEREDFVQKQYVPLWSLLGFQAGFVNAFGFLACGKYVSHVTGFGTQIGVALAETKIIFALELLGFPLFFIFGSFCSAFFTIARIERKVRPRFDLVTLALPVFLIFLVFLAKDGFFGPFGEQLIRTRDFALLFALSFICGMQNGCFATLTKGQIRTTHLTGISTDIGTDLARIWFGSLNSTELALTRKTNFSRIATFCSFSLGSVASVFASQEFGYGGLYIPLSSSIIIFIATTKISQNLDSKFNEKRKAAA